MDNLALSPPNPVNWAPERIDWPRMTRWAQRLADSLGPRWVDVKGPVVATMPAGALTIRNYRSSIAQLYCLEYDANAALTWSFQMPHNWVPRSNVHPHMHVIPLANGSGWAGFEIQYAWAKRGQIVPDTWTTVYGADYILASDRYKEIASDLFPDGIKPPDWAGASSHLILAARRWAAKYTYTTMDGGSKANLAILDLDVHALVQAPLGGLSPWEGATPIK